MGYKERRELYLRAVEEIQHGKTGFMCVALENVSNRTACINNYPELFWFKPEERDMGFHIGWLPYEEKQARINILLLCAEMCKN